MEDDQGQHPESLLPYDEWTQEALRHVVARAIAYVAAHGLPGDHHFYLTFRTDHPGTVIPARLKAQYPHEMTIVLQHQFRDLTVGEAEGLISVVLSFGGVLSTLVIPLAAVTGFADPHVQFMLRFQPANDAAEPEPEPEAEPEPKADESEQPASPPQVVSLDAFRRRTPPKTE
jgi:hypothetical protein